jgi:hypothetical protein
MGTQGLGKQSAARGRRNFCKAKVRRKEVRYFCSPRCGGAESSSSFMSMMAHSRRFRHPLLNLWIPPTQILANESAEFLRAPAPSYLGTESRARLWDLV